MVAAYFLPLPLPPPDTERELVQIGEDNETAAGGEKNGLDRLAESSLQRTVGTLNGPFG
jgi:hypothetical protein